MHLTDSQEHPDEATFSQSIRHLVQHDHLPEQPDRVDRQHEDEQNRERTDPVLKRAGWAC